MLTCVKVLADPYVLHALSASSFSLPGKRWTPDLENEFWWKRQPQSRCSRCRRRSSLHPDHLSSSSGRALIRPGASLPLPLPSHQPLPPASHATQVRAVPTPVPEVNHDGSEPTLLAVVGLRVGPWPSSTQYCEEICVEELLRKISLRK